MRKTDIPTKEFLSQSYLFMTTVHIGEHNIVFTIKIFVFTCLHVLHKCLFDHVNILPLQILGLPGKRTVLCH